MKLKPYYDFFLNEQRVYLTPKGRDRFCWRYVSPSKIINFFYGKTEFEVWKSLFFSQRIETHNITEKENYSLLEEEVRDILPQRIETHNITEKENYSLLEEEVRDYLKNRSGLNLDFFGYGFWEENVFLKRGGVESKLGGVPDGLCFSQDDKVLSVLEIKLNNSYNSTLQGAWFSYLLQISLYMYLSGTSIGYICIVENSLKDVCKNAVKNIRLHSPLKKVGEHRVCSEKRESVVLGEVEINYEILEEFENDSDRDTNLHLFKIHLNTELGSVFRKMCEWWNKYNSQSPKMSKRELKDMLRYCHETK